MILVLLAFIGAGLFFGIFGYLVGVIHGWNEANEAYGEFITILSEHV